MGCCGDDDGGGRKNIEDPGDGGELIQFDPNFNGPVKDRSCTDILCCLLFIVCFVGFLGVGIFAYTKGDPTLLLYPTDSQGNLCGYGTYSDLPYLFFFDLLECARVGPAVTVMGCPTPQVCVAECPKEYWSYYTTTGNIDTNKLICQYHVNLSTVTDGSIRQLVQDEECAAYYLESESLAGRCVPVFITDAINKIEEGGDLLLDRFNDTISADELEEGTRFLAVLLNAKEYGMKIYQDVRASWWMILVGLVLAMIWCFLWIFLMRWLAGIMVWVTIFLFIAVFALATGYCGYKYYKLRNLPGSSGAFEFTTNLDYYLNLTYTWLALGSLSLLVLLIVVIVILFLRMRIKIAIALIKEASKAVGYMFTALFWPLIPWVLQIALFTYWAASAIYLASMGSVQGSLVGRNTTYDDGGNIIEQEVDELLETVPCDPSENTTAGDICNFLRYGGDQFTKYLQVFQLFMLFWLANFIVALGQLTLAGSFSSYYWAFDKDKDMPSLPVLSSLGRALRFHMGTAVFGAFLLAFLRFLRFILDYIKSKVVANPNQCISFVLKYHVGTLAFGSLLIALVQLIRVFLEYLDRKLKGNENKAAKYFLKCLKCCFWCLEKFLKFLNKNAYIMTAIYGYNFCRAAVAAFNLILRNIIRVAVVDKVTDFIVLIGKLVVVGVICMISVLFLSGDLSRLVRNKEVDEFLQENNPELNNYITTVVIIGLGSYVIASGFFAVYSMGVDTLFLCFLQDLEVNDGSAEKPYRMSRSLMKIIGKKNDPAVEKVLKERRK